MTHPSNPIRKITGLTCLLGILPVAFWAKDFWEEKPFTSWSQKEALRILSDSPWGKIQHITLPSSEWDLGGVTTPSGNVPPPISSPQGGAVGRTGDVQGDSSSGRNAPGAGVPGGYGGEPGGASRSVPFQVSWYSSAKVRQAVGRLGQLQGGVSTEQVNSFVQQPVENYIIAVSGPLMKPLEQATLESLKGKTFLISKKVKNKKLELKEYVPPKERKDGLALFTFPRELEGKPSLDAADEEVQFVAEPAGVQIKTTFKLSKMMTDGKLDI
jgi:hypothetical protein